MVFLTALEISSFSRSRKTDFFPIVALTLLSDCFSSCFPCASIDQRFVLVTRAIAAICSNRWTTWIFFFLSFFLSFKIIGRIEKESNVNWNNLNVLEICRVNELLEFAVHSLHHPGPVFSNLPIHTHEILPVDNLSTEIGMTTERRWIWNQIWIPSANSTRLSIDIFGESLGHELDSPSSILPRYSMIFISPSFLLPWSSEPKKYQWLPCRPDKLNASKILQHQQAVCRWDQLKVQRKQQGKWPLGQELLQLNVFCLVCFISFSFAFFFFFFFCLFLN